MGETEVLVVMVTFIRENEESMLNVSVSTEPDNTVLVRWTWSEAGKRKPSGYLIKWNEKEQQLSQDISQFSIPVEDETALLVTLQTLGETVEEYETLIKLRCQDLDKQKEEALILILKRKAELLRDIARVKKDVDENQKEIAFFEDPIAFENERQATKQKELKKAIQKFNRSPKKG